MNLKMLIFKHFFESLIRVWHGHFFYYYLLLFIFITSIFFIVDLLKLFWEVIPIVIANNQAWKESVFAVPKILKVLFLSIPRHYFFIMTRTLKSKTNYDNPDDAISRLLEIFGTANRNLPYWGVGNALKKINSLLTPPPRGSEGCLYDIEPLEETYLFLSLFLRHLLRIVGHGW